MVKRSQRNYNQEDGELMVDQRDNGEEDVGDGSKNQVAQVKDQRRH